MIYETIITVNMWLISFLSIFLGILYFFKYIQRSYFLFTITGFFLVKYIALILLGSLLLNTFIFEYQYNIGVYERKDVLFQMWLFSLISFWGLILGITFAEFAFKKTPLLSMKNLKLHLKIKPILIRINLLTFIFLLTFILSLIFFLIYRKQIGILPIEGLIKGISDSWELKRLRSIATNAFEGKYYLYALFIKKIPFIFTIFLYFLKDYNKKLKLLFYIFLLFTTFTHIMDLQKYPIMEFLLALFIAKVFKEGFNLKRFFLFSSIITLLLVFLTKFFMGVKKISSTLSGILNRIFIVPAATIYFWILYQEVYDYLYGKSLPNPHHIFPFEHIRISVEVMYLAFPELYKYGVVGSMPAPFFMNWWINFGIGWMIIGSILLGFILRSFDIYFIRAFYKYNFHFALLSVYIYFMLYFSHFVETSFEGIIFAPSLYFPIFLSFILFRYFKIKTPLDGYKNLPHYNSPPQV